MGGASEVSIMHDLMCHIMRRRSDSSTSTTRSPFSTSSIVSSDLDDTASMVTDVKCQMQSIQQDFTASASSIKTTIAEISTASANAKNTLNDAQAVAQTLSSTITNLLGLLPQNSLTRDQFNCIKDSFTCCICRGNCYKLNTLLYYQHLIYFAVHNNLCNLTHALQTYRK
jgi:hypothetical protein